LSPRRDEQAQRAVTQKREQMLRPMSDNDGHAGKRLPFPLGAPLLVAALFAAAPAGAATLTRGPYLQLLTPNSVTIVWNTDTPAACSLAIRPVAGSSSVIQGGTDTVCAIPVD